MFSACRCCRSAGGFSFFQNQCCILLSHHAGAGDISGNRRIPAGYTSTTRRTPFQPSPHRRKRRPRPASSSNAYLQSEQCRSLFFTSFLLADSLKLDDPYPWIRIPAVEGTVVGLGCSRICELFLLWSFFRPPVPLFARCCYAQFRSYPARLNFHVRLSNSRFTLDGCPSSIPQIYSHCRRSSAYRTRC